MNTTSAIGKYLGRVAALLALALCLCAPVPGAAAATLTLVSHVNGSTAYGTGNSGSEPGFGAVLTRPQALDDGRVVFISAAALTPGSADGVYNPFQTASGGTVSLLAVPPLRPIIGGSDYRNSISCRLAPAGTTGFLVRERSSDFQPCYAENTIGANFGATFTPFPTPLGATLTGLDFCGATAVYARSDLPGIVLLDYPPGAAALTSTVAGGNQNAAYAFSSPSLSAEGRRLVFATTAPLLAGHPNGISEIYFYDRTVAQSPTLTSPTLTGASSCSAPAISGDGNSVAYIAGGQVFVWNSTSATTTQVSVTADGAAANVSDCAAPRLSYDGRFVIYLSAATNLVSGVTSNRKQLFLYDRDTHLVSCLSVNGTGTPADVSCVAADISPSGRYVSIATAATNLVTGLTANTYVQVYRADRGTDYLNHPPVVTPLVLSATVGTPVTVAPSVTDADGDTTLFVRATSLPLTGQLTRNGGGTVVVGTRYATTTFPWTYTPADANPYQITFTMTAYDGKADGLPAAVEINGSPAGAGFISLCSVNTADTQGNDYSGSLYPPYTFKTVSVSGDGASVTFFSTANNLAPTGQTPQGSPNIFLRTRTVGSEETRCLSVDANDLSLTQHRYSLVSGDGAYVAYNCQGSGLLRYNVSTASRDTIDSTITNVSSLTFAISRDGMRVLYLKPNGAAVWLWDARATADNTLRQVSAPGLTNCQNPALSADGTVAAFIANDTVYWQNLDDTGAAAVPVSTDQTGTAITGVSDVALSATGRFVLFPSSTAGQLVLKDTGSGAATLLSGTTGATRIALSANGRFIYYVRSGQAYRYDCSTQNEQLLSHVPTSGQFGGNGSCYAGALSATGRFVAFSSTSSDLLMATDANGAKCDVFVNDFGDPTNALPVPTRNAFTLDENTPASGHAVAADIPLDFTDADGDDAEVEIVTPPAHAPTPTVLHNAPGRPFAALQYTPNLNYVGSDSFSYRCRDAVGWSQPQTVSVTVTNVNDPPVLAAITDRTINEGQTLDIALQASDPDLANPTPDVLAFAVTAGPGEIIGGHYVYQPPYSTVAPHAAPVVFGVQVGVSDGHGGTAAQAFQLQVTQAPRSLALAPYRLVFSRTSTGGTVAFALLGLSYSQVNTDDVDASLEIDLGDLPGTWVITDSSGHPVSVTAGRATLVPGQFPLTITVTDSSYSDRFLQLTARNGDGSSTGPLTWRIITGAQLQPLELAKGWNLIALPMTPTDPLPADFASQNFAPGTILSTPWAWDAQERRFVLPAALQAGNAFWLYCLTSVSANIPGAPVTPTAWSLVSGWNFLGPVGTAATFAPPAGGARVWAYDARSGCYKLQLAEQPLTPGRGYAISTP